jgi:hypothetical protein
MTGHKTCERRGWLFAATLLAIVSASSNVRAWDDGDLSEPKVKASRNETPRLRAQDVDRAVENVIFGDNGLGSSHEQKLRERLRARIQQLSRSHSVSNEQEGKLLLAGQGDLRRFLDRVEELKGRIRSVSRDQIEWNRILRDAQPLQTQLRAGLFDRNSLFGKTLAKMGGSEQPASFVRTETDRSRFQHRAAVNMTVLRLSTALGLSDEQRTRLKAVLLEETRPVRSLSVVPTDLYSNSVYAQLRLVSEAKLKTLFEPWQWQALRIKLASAPKPREDARGLIEEAATIRERPALRRIGMRRAVLRASR